MNYTPDEIMQYVLEEDVKFIRLAFCDIFGTQKNIAIMPDGLPAALADGVLIDASPITGFDGEMILKPDTATLMELPWRPQHGRVVHFFCDVCDAGGKPIETDPRTMLKAKNGHAAVGLEQTFYLMKLDDNGEPTAVPHDRAGYLDIAPEDRGENVRREICLTLERMGIKPISSHHERGPGQHLVTFAPSDPVSAADNAISFSAVVRTIAAQYGLFADFSPEPLIGEAKNTVTLTVNGAKKVELDTGRNPYLLVLENL